MIRCPHRSDPSALLAVCSIGRIEVHIELCTACEASGPADEENPNRHLASAIMLGWSTGAHKQAALANRAREAILQTMPNYPAWRETVRIAPLECPGEEATRCLHLGKVTKRAGCGCWRIHSYECEARGLTVIPLRDCPCAQYEEA